MSLPVVASDIRGNRQAVLDGETGRIVPVRDPAALAAAIADYAENPSVRRAHGAAASALAAREFDQARVIDRTLAAYELLDSKSTVR